ncbi:MAG: hypothetical protein MMC33_006101 [Icmadophila ericetorum]|nr:hypothetical protein [Icmadophila ericetorum]
MPPYTSISSPLIARQPVKAVYVLYALSTTLFLHLPYAALKFILPFARPHPKWTYYQSLINTLVGNGLVILAKIRMQTPVTLAAGVEKGRFVVMEGVEGRRLEGVARSEQVKPGKVGGTWYPEAMPGRWEEEEERKGGVVLMFHGGAYITGSGRDGTCAGAAKLLIKALPDIRVLAVDYRLSCHSRCHFPAALQDAISAYSYLLNEKGIPASKIVLCGDSAGGNLCLALLRYIADQGPREIGTPLPWPVGALLWSPWLNLAQVQDLGIIASNTDYLFQAFVGWGVEAFVGPSGFSANDPYISPVRHPFVCKTALWIMAGGLELLYDSIMEFKEGMEGLEGRGELVVHVESLANHDIFLLGDVLGFQTERERCIGIATNWMAEKGVGKAL